jgi:hypothetical protein
LLRFDAFYIRFSRFPFTKPQTAPDASHAGQRRTGTPRRSRSDPAQHVDAVQAGHLEVEDRELVLLLSAKTREHDVELGFAEGADDYVISQEEQARQRIEAALHQDE